MLLTEYRKRWYLFLLCLLLVPPSLVIAFYTPILFVLAFDLPFNNTVTFVVSLVLFVKIAPLPIRILNMRLAKKHSVKIPMFLTSLATAVAQFLTGIAIFTNVVDIIDWGSGREAFGFHLSYSVVYFWAFVPILLIIFAIIKLFSRFKRKGVGTIACVLIFSMLVPTANVSANTTHGYLSMRYIRHMNDHLYERAAFTYRELEAADWIVSELLAMGHSRESVDIQEFHGRLTFDIFTPWFNLDFWVYSASEIVLTRFMSGQRLRNNLVRLGNSRNFYDRKDTCRPRGNLV